MSERTEMPPLSGVVSAVQTLLRVGEAKVLATDSELITEGLAAGVRVGTGVSGKPSGLIGSDIDADRLFGPGEAKGLAEGLADGVRTGVPSGLTTSWDAEVGGWAGGFVSSSLSLDGVQVGSSGRSLEHALPMDCTL